MSPGRWVRHKQDAGAGGISARGVAGGAAAADASGAGAGAEGRGGGAGADGGVRSDHYPTMLPEFSFDRAVAGQCASDVQGGAARAPLPQHLPSA
eukprot:4691826-Prymnesium_polylepis.1